MVTAVENSSNESLISEVLSEAEKGFEKIEASESYIPGRSFLGMPKTIIDVVEIIFTQLKDDKIQKNSLSKRVFREYSREKMVEVIREAILTLGKNSTDQNIPLKSCEVWVKIKNPGLFVDSLRTFQVTHLELS